jgi:hypothetical protein
MGIRIGTETHAGTVTSMQKLWRSLQALGAIAFADSFSIILIEIQVLQAYIFCKLHNMMVVNFYSNIYRIICANYLRPQDTIRSPPAEHKTMKKATFFSIAITTVFYLLCGAMGYAAFGDDSPGNLLTGFGFYNPYWLLDIANVAIVVHLVGAYQVCTHSQAALRN